jgi:hypothetical protein
MAAGSSRGKRAIRPDHVIPIISPCHLVTKLTPRCITWIVSYKLTSTIDVNLLLDTKPKASPAVFDPKTIDDSQILAGKVFDIIVV